VNARISSSGNTEEIRFTAGCKINIGLTITGRRADGFHLIDSLFFPLDEPHDELFIRETADEAIRVECAEQGIDIRNNTLTKAWEVFRKHTGKAPGLHVRLVKGIPWGAGLGGGSSDAAVLLLFLRDWLERQSGGVSVSDGEMAVMACGVGADVPFFLNRTPMRVTGIGDRITPCPVSLPGSELLLVTPDIRVSTPWAYKAFDGLVPGFSPKPASPAQTVPAALTTTHEEDKGVSLLCTPGNAFVNDLETAVFPRYPELADIKRSLLELGAAAASMSGSGSSIFGIFSDAAVARSAERELSTNWPVHHLHIRTGM